MDNPICQTIEVRTKDVVQFECIRCGNCCRHVAESVMLEPLDAYRLARFLRGRGEVESVTEVYDKYTGPVILDYGYPIFALNTGGTDQTCVFLVDNRCRIYEARPRTCRLYPFTVDQGTRGRDFQYLQCIDNNAGHFGTGRTSVKDWMYENFSKEARQYFLLECGALARTGQLYGALSEAERRDILFTLLHYRYFNYDLDRPFLEQYKENQATLEKLLREMTGGDAV